MENPDKYVSYNGKRLRKGYTTGTCATAASLGSILMIKNQDYVDQVRVSTPSGTELNLNIENQSFLEREARCSVVKDGGDDYDVTHGAHIFAKVSLRDDGKISIDGGQGVGRISQEGLSLDIGQAAINPVPRQMIYEVAEENLPQGYGADIIISVPGGEEIAKKTFNPRLGIEGGISILGTSGIVTPMSEEGWKASITMELEMKKKQGMDRIILTPGGYGETFVKERTRLNPKYIVQMSNFVGYVLLEAIRIGFDKILMVGHLGKFIKISAGIFSTHSRDADARSEIMVANLALMGAPLDLLEKVNDSPTTEGQAAIILDHGYEDVYRIIVDKIKKRSLDLLKSRNPHIDLEAIGFLKDHDIVEASCPIEKLEEDFI